MTNVDHYSILGLRPDASDDQIRKAFRRLALIHHPDKNPGDVQAAGRFRRIAEAYRVLGDSKRRSAYDLANSGREEQVYGYEAYLRVALEKKSLLLNEEIILTVCFPSEGRAFRKPALEGWEIAAGPAVSHRMENGHRETVLQYTLCPLRTGCLVVPVAQIHFHGKAVWSELQEVDVLPATCWFSNGLAAGHSPLRIRLYKLHEIRTARFTKTVVVPRTVLIPRSDLAAYYHRIGRILKIAFPLLFIPLAMMQGIPLIVGMLTGSLFAGLNARLMYSLMGIKPRCGRSMQFPAVVSRLDEGYYFGNSPPLWSGRSRLLRFRFRDWLL